MRYWDPSALVPLVAAEATTPAATEAFGEDGSIVTWWGSEIECESALARRERDAPAIGSSYERARQRLLLLREGWQEIQPSAGVRATAIRVLRTHPLRAGDALQLAAAIVAAAGDPASLSFVTLDARLAHAASKEGFPVLRPGAT